MEVQITKSKNRRKTVSARLVNDVIVVKAPEKITDIELERIVAKFQKRFARQKRKKELAGTEDLHEIAQKLNRQHFAGMAKVTSIEYSINQNVTLGNCNYRTRTIRISHRLSQMPTWVRDYVIVHELAHILEPNHSEAFWRLVNRYELTERARGYLLAKGVEVLDKDGLECG